MKVIELLTKIANGEEVPKKVSINAEIHGIDTWVYDEHYEDYKNGADEMLLYSGMTTNHLNDEVEIIEEDKKIEKLTHLNNVSNASDLVAISQMQWENNSLIERKINEIIDYINKE